MINLRYIIDESVCMRVKGNSIDVHDISYKEGAFFDLCNRCKNVLCFFFGEKKTAGEDSAR